MNRLTLRLPKSLHQSLVVQAKTEGISLNQLIVYHLARSLKNYSAFPVSDEHLKQQEQSFQQYRQQASIASPKEFEQILAESEDVTEEEKAPKELRDAFKAVV